MIINLKINNMGWGIDFKADVYLSRQSYRSKGDVLDRIEELSSEINDIETRINMFAAATPRDVIMEKDVDNAVGWLSFELKCLFESYQEALSNKVLLGLYIAYLTENNIEIIKSE